MYKGVKRLRQMENSMAVQTTEDREVGLGSCTSGPGQNEPGPSAEVAVEARCGGDSFISQPFLEVYSHVTPRFFLETSVRNFELGAGEMSPWLKYECT